MAKQLAISSEYLRAEISTMGAKVVNLRGRVGDEWVYLGQLFCAGPVVNRARDGKILVDGDTFNLEHPIHPADSLHGVWPWIEHDLIEQSASSVTLKFERRTNASSFPYPSNYTGTTHYYFKGNVLHVKLQVENMEDRPLPVGLVSHPLFPKSITDDIRPEIFFAAESYYPTKDNLPTGRRLPIPPELDYGQDHPMRVLGDGVDNCYFGWGGVARVRYALTGFEWVIVDRLKNCRHLQFWSPSHLEVFALEPQTSVGDACNLNGRRDFFLPDLGLEILRSRGEKCVAHHSYAWMPLVLPVK